MKVAATLGHWYLFLGLSIAGFAQSSAEAIRDQLTSSGAAKPELAIQAGHATGIQKLAVSPDGALLASVGSDRTVRIWDANTGIELRTISSGTHMLHAAAFSPIKEWIAIASNAVELWDLRSGQKIKTLADMGELFGYLSVAISPDGRHLAAGQNFGDIDIWDLDSERPKRTFKGHAGGLDCLAFSPDGKLLVSGGHDKTIRIWDVQTGISLRTLPAPDQVNLVLFSPKGDQLVSAYNLETQATVWNPRTWNAIVRVPATAWTGNNLAYSPDGRVLVVANPTSSALDFLDTATWKPLSTTSRSTDSIAGVVFSPHGDWVATGSWLNSIFRIYDRTNPNPIREIVGHVHQLRGFALTNDGHMMATLGYDYTLRLWDLEMGIEAKKLPRQGEEQWTSLALSPDGSGVAVGMKDSVRIWKVKTGQNRIISTGEGFPKEIAFNSDGSILAIGSGKGLRLIEAEDGKLIHLLVHDEKEPDVSRIQFSHDGKLVAAGNNDETASIWDVSTGKELQVLSMRNPGESKPTISDNPSSLNVLAFLLNYRAISGFAFSPDDRTLFTAASKAGVMEWDVATGDKVNTFHTKTWSGLPTIALNPDGRYLAASNEDGSVSVLQTDGTGDPRILPSLGDPIYSMTFHPSGHCLMTIGTDGSVRARELSDGRESVRLVPLDKNDWAAVDSEGRFDASDGGMKLLRWVVGFETIGLDQLKERYYDPGLLAKTIGTGRDPLRDVTPFRTVKLYPEVRAAIPTPGNAQLKLQVLNRGGGIGRVQVLVNGKEIVSDARAPNQDQNAVEAALTVNLAGAPIIPGEPNDVRIVTWNSDGYLASGGVSVSYQPNGARDESSPEFYAIVSGISEYSSPNLRLRFAAKDARNMAHTLEVAARRLFGDGHVHVVLLTSPAMSGEQLASKRSLAKAFETARRARTHDVFVVYLAGHGVAIRDKYAYPTQEARTLEFADTALLQQAAVSSEELVDWINKIPALHQVMILDTCAAGAVAAPLIEKRDVPGDQIRAIDRLKDRTGFYVLMGSAADAVSYETTQFGEGILTYALLKGMKGAALRDGKFVDVEMLFSEAENQVPQLASGIGGIQQPRVAIPHTANCKVTANCSSAASFDIGELFPEDRDAIQLATNQPLVSRPLFLNTQSHRDDLHLTDLLRERLRNESYGPVPDGKPSPMAYVDEMDFSGAVGPTGDYRVDGNRVIVTVVLTRDNRELGHFSVPGAIGHLDTLAADLVNAIEHALPR